jgi:hypothetical protein
MKQVVNTDASDSKVAFSSSTPSLDLSENEDHVNSINKNAVTTRGVSFKIRNIGSRPSSLDVNSKRGHFREHSFQAKINQKLVSQQNLSLSSVQFDSERNLSTK